MRDRRYLDPKQPAAAIAPERHPASVQMSEAAELHGPIGALVGCALGPSGLDSEMKPTEIVARLDDRRFMRRGLGRLLLPQSFVAGLGNYLRSEIFFEACLHPSQRAIDLETAARLRLAKAILLMANRADQIKGVPLRKGPDERFDLAGRWVCCCSVCQPPLIQSREEPVLVL